jgi:hypothetical protein
MKATRGPARPPQTVTLAVNFTLLRAQCPWCGVCVSAITPVALEQAIADHEAAAHPGAHAH